MKDTTDFSGNTRDEPHYPEVYAHSGTKQDRSDWEPLQDHARNVAQAAAKNGEAFGPGACAMLGWTHDLGKMKPRFQARLSDNTIVEPHSAEGAKFVRKAMPGPLGSVLAQAILGHHAGLPDAGGQGRDLTDRLSAVEDLSPPEGWDLPPTAHILPECLMSLDPRSGQGPNFALSFFGRMAFSALIDADRSETARFYDPKRIPGPYTRLEDLRDRLDAYMSSLPGGTEMRNMRGEIHDHVRDGADLDPGLFTLTVPTGGGKTLSSLGFALDHAIAHGMDRVIFVIPFTSIVEQTADVFRKVFGDLGDQSVLEHHASFDEGSLPSDDDRESRRMASENWDRPVIVTTAVQFLESLHAASPAKCRKLHNVANAVVILDEAQSMPRHLLRPTLASLKELARGYRSSVVFCTATQPAICREDGFPHKEGLERSGRQPVRELAPDPRHLYECLRRVEVRYASKMTEDHVIEALASPQGGLCIVNNRRHARALYQAARSLGSTFHLSTSMTAQHRRSALRSVRAALKTGPVRLISTSLIEAGVDISFPLVLRENAGLDSIAQAAGRCNREGECEGYGQTVVFDPASNEFAPPEDLRKMADVTRRVLKEHRDDPLSLAAIRSYFEQIYWRSSYAMDRGTIDGLPFSIMDAIAASGRRDVQFPYASIEKAYRMISETGLPVIVSGGDWGIDEGLLLEIARRGDATELSRAVQPYQIQVPEKAFTSMLETQDIAPIFCDLYGQQFHVLRKKERYDDDFGLAWDDISITEA